MTAEPYFSIILPTHNRAAMLRSAVKSVLAQTYEGFELFVLDDGSTDLTPEVFREFSGDSRVRLHRFEDNRRQHVRRNFALSRSRGEFVSFIDSDDLWLPDRLESFRRYLESNPAADFVFSNAYILRHGCLVGKLFDSARPIPEGKVPGWYAVGGKFLPYLTSNLALRSSLFERVGRFREDFQVLEDTELYARMLAQGARVGVLRRPLAVCRRHPEQITHDYAVAYRESLEALKAGGAPPDVYESRRRSLARAAAGYFWRSGRPARARSFLLGELGSSARGLPDYWRTWVPGALLRAARALRRLTLVWRHAPGRLAPEERAAYEQILPWLEEESVTI